MPVSFGFFVALLVMQSSLAFDDATIRSLKRCHATSSTANLAAYPNIRRSLERRLPRGTRVFIGEPTRFYVVSGGRRSTTADAKPETVFSCDADGLRVLTRGQKRGLLFPFGSHVTLESDAPHFYVKPGSRMPSDLSAMLRRGEARYAKTL